MGLNLTNTAHAMAYAIHSCSVVYLHSIHTLTVKAYIKLPGFTLFMVVSSYIREGFRV